MPAISTMPSSFNSYTPRNLKVVGTICINSNNEVLLVRGRSTQKWSFPKGHLKKSETDLECARRELFEETGILAPDTYVSYHKLKAASYYTFQIDTMPNLQILDNWEVDAVTWWPISTLPERDANIDVSIFRTLMKYIHKNQPVFAFINSNFAFTKISSIKKSIEDKAMKQTRIPLQV